MVRIQIKPLSVNDAYTGKRYATPELKQYKHDLFYLLPRIKVPQGKIGAKYVFGLSSKNADGDNYIKAFQDIVADTYRFNDRTIYKWDIEKVDVAKGEEFVEFELYTVSDS